jgi:hypothetical protein
MNKILNLSKYQCFRALTYRKVLFCNFYNFNKFQFARNNSIKTKNNNLTLDDNISLNKNIEEEIIANYVNENIPLTHENIELILTKLYKRGKVFQIENKQITLEENGEFAEYLEYYNYLVKNIKNLIHPKNLLDKFVITICYFQKKDEHTLDILNKLYNSDPLNQGKFSCLIVYAFAKLNVMDESLLSKCLSTIGDSELIKYDKSNVVPFIWGLSELEKSNKEVNRKIDEFVKENINQMSEYVMHLI